MASNPCHTTTTSLFAKVMAAADEPQTAPRTGFLCPEPRPSRDAVYPATDSAGKSRPCGRLAKMGAVQSGVGF